MDPENSQQCTQPSTTNGTTTDIVNAMSKVNMDNEHTDTEVDLDNKNTEKPHRPLFIYPRPQMLKLSKSPLVKPPDGMPALKDWFGCVCHHTYRNAE